MQEPALSLALVLRRLETVGREVTVASAGPGGVVRHTWGEIGERARRLAGALDGLGVPRRGRVATLAWNSHRHLELFYGVPCSDRVLHTLNARLRPEDLLEMARRTGDEVLFVDASLTPLLAEHAARLPFREVVVMDDGVEPAAAFADRPRYEELLAAAEPLWELPEPDERAAVCVCHTTGTTGRPKGVVYSHRSVVLHALGALAIDAHGVSRAEVALPLTPMFHLMGWGMPYSTALAPCPLVLAGADTSPAAIAALVESERATLVAGVPTFFVRLAAELDGDRDLSSLRRVLAGGSPSPPALVARYLEAGIDFVPTWGMTEAGSGTGGVLHPGADLSGGDRPGHPDRRGGAADRRRGRRRAALGRHRGRRARGARPLGGVFLPRRRRRGPGGRLRRWLAAHRRPRPDRRRRRRPHRRPRQGPDQVGGRVDQLGRAGGPPLRLPRASPRRR